MAEPPPSDGHVIVAMDRDVTDEAMPFHHRGANDTRSYLSLDANQIFNVVWNRTSVLVSLLLLQSLSQFILEMYETLISKHVIIPLFLTMLVGAGGNAGNQATVRAITGLASGEFSPHDYVRLLVKESMVGVINATLLAGIGFARVYYFYGTHDMFYSTVAITLSLFAIVVISAILGCTLPFLIGGLGFDREHAAPVIQVTMDIVGVFVTCAICTWMIPDAEGRNVKGR
jgi:Mg/Co/Ni transporter MgtE